jgi:hypothetical protein
MRDWARLFIWALLDCTPSSHLQAIKGLQDGGQHWHDGAGDEMQVHKAQPARYIHVSVQFRQETLEPVMRCTLIKRSLQCPYMYKSKSGSKVCCTLKAGCATSSGMKIPAPKNAWQMVVIGAHFLESLSNSSASASPSCKILFHEPVEHSSRGQSVVLMLFIGGVIDWTCRQGTIMLDKM